MQSKKIVKIQKKILRFVLPAVVIALLVVVAVSYYSTKSSIQEKTERLLAAQAKESAYEVEAWAAEILGTLQNAADTIVDLNMDEDEILEYEGFYLDTYEDFPNGIYIGNDQGKVYDATGWSPDGDATQTSWYLEGMAHDTMQFGEPYLDDYTGGMIVTASTNKDNVDGHPASICSDISLDILAQIVTDMSVEGDGNAYIMDVESACILAHTDTSLCGMAIADLSDSFYSTILNAIADGSDYSGIVDSADGSYMVTTNAVPNTNWVIVVRALEKNVYSDLTKIIMILVILAIVVIAVITVLIVTVVGRIVKPIDGLTKTIESVTGGDFTADVTVSGNDEISVMAGSMKNFMSTMRNTLSGIQNISMQIDTQAQDSNAISGELMESASGQADAMEQMRENLEELVQSISLIAENATNLAMVVSESNDAGEHAIEDIQNTLKAAEQGKSSMANVTESMNVMQQELDELGTSINNVENAAVKINEITTTIRDIAEETNLLSLNASIEAARAGEVGKGFAVVATEIKSLAESSAAAADEISELIASVTELIHETVRQSQDSVENIKENTEKVYVAADQFNTICGHIESTNRMVNSMIESVKEANDVASNMAAVTEEQSASAEEIEASVISIQELANTVSSNSANVKDESSSLADTATSLKDRISDFTI